jgi:hypothetical protein
VDTAICAKPGGLLAGQLLYGDSICLSIAITTLAPRPHEIAAMQSGASGETGDAALSVQWHNVLGFRRSILPFIIPQESACGEGERSSDAVCVVALRHPYHD